MMNNMLKIRAIKALTLLSAYLLSTVGAALIALSCHCEHLHLHTDEACHAVVCCCGHEHAAHAAECSHDEEADAQFAGKCCNHDHSTDTELYTAANDESVDMRFAAAHADAVVGFAGVSPALLPAGAKSFAERRCPPEQKCRTVCRSLRAPPVCA